MSFGGGSGGFTFGGNNNNNTTQSSGFGGFGNNNNNTASTGFGSGSSTAFGSNNNASSSAFGGGGNSAFGGGSGGAFGSNNNASSGGLFGNKTNAFGSGSSGGGLFGSTAANNTSNTGFGSSVGGFGNNNASSAFGGGNTSGSTFGSTFGNNAAAGGSSAFGSSQNKPLFGAGGTGTTGFGSAASSPFGGSGTALGGALPECPGTGGTPFQPTPEKETNGSTSNYQTITFMAPYQKYSQEELRVADYLKGQQFGTGTAGAGAFGQTNFGSSFGGNTGSAFGNNNSSGGGLFGNNTATSGGAFGSNTATAGGFGSSAGGGLFGSQNKPAAGLFGQQTPASTSGGLFGAQNNTTTGGGLFGNTTQTTQQSGGLFGNNNNNQPKPGGLFGSTSGTTGGGFSFGNQQQNNAPASGGLFGSNNASTTGGGLFGNNNQQQQSNTGGGLFGNNSSTTPAQSGGLFGNKPAFPTATTQNQPSGGLFGSTNTASGGLFGNQQNQNNTSGGGLFGNTATNNQQQSGGGLFGNNNNQAKPGGLFGNTGTSGGGLFGNTTNTQQQGGGLFGNANNNNQQASGGLFGNANSNAGGGLFGNNQAKPGGLFNTAPANNQAGNSLFGNTNAGGFFGQSQNNQQGQQLQQQNQNEVKHASLLDPNPYGQSSIWTGLPNPTPDNSKPLFTPLTATKKLEESARKPLPTMRLNQSRYMTPPRRNGFGFSYSTYGTPNSAASTPGGVALSGSMYGNRGWSGGSFGRSFNRSASVQNLRSHYTGDGDDIWKPNAFAPSHRNSGGSIKRLTIDRSIRQDLFNRPPPVPALPAPKPATNGESSAPAQITDGNTEPPRKLNKRVSFENNVHDTQLNGETGALQRIEDPDEEVSPPPRATTTELQVVPEDSESHQVSSKPSKSSPTADPEPGDYWMKPTRKEMSKMPRDQLKAFKGFQVGRQGCGFVTFDGTVDLTKIDFDKLYHDTVRIKAREVCVYPDADRKPPVGMGLNVPSTIALENSWPRSQQKPISDTSGRRYEKHIKRLQQIEGTEFVSYDAHTGCWTFKVPHYTRYGLDYDDDESEMDQSELSLPPHSIDKSADASVVEVDEYAESDGDDDTFAFKKSVPGQFGNRSLIPTDEDEELASDPVEGADYDSSQHSAETEEDMMSDVEEMADMPGSMPPPPQQFLPSPQKAPSKPTIPGTPGKPLLDLEGDWADQLQQTISPRKQNRQVLREAQDKVILDKVFSPIKPKPAPQVNFRSSIDIMNSMFKPANSKSNKTAEPEFEFPYSKRPKTFHPDDEQMSQQDRGWHDSFKPNFTTDGQIVYRTSKPNKDNSWKEVPVTGDQHAVIALGRQEDTKPFNVDVALASSTCKLVKGVPSIEHRPIAFSQLEVQAQDKEVAKVYNLAHVLFDDYEDEFTRGLSGTLQKDYDHRIRKDRLTQFLVDSILSTIGDAQLKELEQVSPLRAAILRLTGNDIHGACVILKQSQNFRLLLLVAQLNSADKAFMEDAKLQLDAWREQNALSEFDSDIRTLYELCAGNVTTSHGNVGPKVPVEHRAETFNIGQRYGLSWLQCFALGLFYGKEEKGGAKGISTIEGAVKAYQSRCDRGDEPTKAPEDDVIWSLLRLYASTKDKSISAPSFPSALEGLARPFNSSDLFNFHQAAQANLNVDVDLSKADTLAENLSSELSTKGDLAASVYALLHISNTTSRTQLIQDLLDRFAAILPGPDTATTDDGIALWQRLTMDFKIPTNWIYMAKARYAASSSNDNNIPELRYLVAAESWSNAHECLLKRVAPTFIIDQDYPTLLSTTALFGDDPSRHIPDWSSGGAIYHIFAQVMTNQISRTNTSTLSALRKNLTAFSHKLSRSQAVKLGHLNQHQLEEHVAIKEMANTLARLAIAGTVDLGSTKDILDMPITQDVRVEVEMLAADKHATTGAATSMGSGITRTATAAAAATASGSTGTSHTRTRSRGKSGKATNTTGLGLSSTTPVTDNDGDGDGEEDEDTPMVTQAV